MMAAVIVQSLIAGFATWYAGYVVKKTKNESRVLQFATIGFQFAVSLLCRFAAIRSSVYIDCIMTEGVCLSLFVLFTVELYLCMITEKKRHIAAARIFSAVQSAEANADYDNYHGCSLWMVLYHTKPEDTEILRARPSDASGAFCR